MTTWGLLPTGFKPMAQQDIIADLQAALQASFGNQVNLADESVFGQIVGIMSERYALLWSLGQAIYANTYPSGAVGVSVDNILALQNLTRLAASATVTNPSPVVQTNGVTLYGLVLYGTPGTVVPAGSLISNGASPAVTFSTDADITINAAANAVQTVMLSNQPTSGEFALSFVDAYGQTLTTASMPYNVQATTTWLSWPTAPSTGSYQLSLGGQTTTSLPYNATAAQVQAAVNALPTFGNVMVTGSVTSGMMLVFASSYISMAYATGTAAPVVTNCVQANINTLYDEDARVMPYTDVAVAGAVNSLTVSFGAFAPPSNQPSSGGMAQPLMQVASSTLQMDNTSTSVTVLNTVSGQAACGTGTATCTQTGPNYVAAGGLTTIVNALTGWSSVTNQLDCITGSNAESDGAALARAVSLRSSQGSTSVQAVVERVSLLDGVTAALGFSNVTNAAQQVLSFGAVPRSGAYQLVFGDGVTAPVAGGSSAAAVQSAIQALPSYSRVQVSGSPAYGLVIDFNGSDGGQAQPLAQVVSNSTGTTITPSYGRPPHSLEVVVQGGTNQAVANAILAAAPAGIATYSTPVLKTLASVTAGSTAMPVASTTGIEIGQGVTCFGVAAGTTVASVSGDTVTLSAAAMGTYTGQTATFDYTTQVTDAAGNPHLIGFSRPTQVPIFVSLQLTTDQYTTPGNPLSGINQASQWSPASVQGILSDLLAVIEGVGIGGLVTARGTNGLDASFSKVPGVVDCALFFDVAPNPTQSAPIRMLPAQVPVAEAANAAVSYV